MIKLKPSYQTTDGTCYATYEGAQQAELAALFAKDGKTLDEGEQLATIIMEHAAEIREILAPQIGRPLGSKNGTGRVRRPKTVPTTDLPGIAQ